MKNLKIVLFAAILLMFAGCESVLNEEPTNLISGPQVFKDQALADAYLNDIYNRLNFQQDGTGGPNFNQVLYEAIGGELRTMGGWQTPYNVATANITEEGTPGALDYWKYTALRNANEFIEQIGKADFDPSYIDQRRAEARFLRSFMYFEMARRYGAVPLITKAQSPNAPEEELLVERTPEQEIYDFVIAEMDTIAAVLPETVGGQGRPTRWAALALKSRTALQAASIGQFDDMKLNGLLGVPDSEVQNYWQIAYDAANNIIDNSGHELYRAESDPSQNFQRLFIDEGNPEGIMYERFDGDRKGHSFSFYAMPAGFAESWGSNFPPFYDMVELFEFTDGSSGAIPRSQLTSQQWSAEELFGDRDPRFRASVFYPETDWQGGQVYFHSSTIVNGEQVTSGTVGDDWLASAPNRNTNRTGFHLRKMVDEGDVVTVDGGLDDTDWMIFRLGEIYLNLAEAAFYLNRPGEARDAINELRDRAGMPDVLNVTEEIIRHERQVELAFEGHRYWDLRRWRIAVDELDGKRMQGLRYDYDWDTKEYNISLRNAEGSARIFQERHYYLPLGVSRLADNPNLVENPGYSQSQ